MTQQRLNKATSVVVIQQAEKINTAKAVVYAVEMSAERVKVGKAIVYAVEAEISGTPDPAEVAKTVVYAVEAFTPVLAVGKAIGYAVEGPDTSGNVFQDVSSERPLYRTGTPPYIEFLTDTSLKINSVFPGVHTLVIYKPDGEFEVQQVTFVSGANELPVINFNQIAIVKGVAPRILIESIKVTMLDRL